MGFWNHRLYGYGRTKVNMLKSFLPMAIILYHVHLAGYPGLRIAGVLGDTVMYLFFAMSGYGLVISYLSKGRYLDGFLLRSMYKLFIPYAVTVLVFFLYWVIEGAMPLMACGHFGMVRTSWFIWVLYLFYIFFFVVFRYVKAGDAAKVLLTILLVAGYFALAACLEMNTLYYRRTPAFCVGMLFAFFDGRIKAACKRWHMLAALVFVSAAVVAAGRNVIFASLLQSAALFLLVYSVGDLPETGIVRFLSSISLEMFLVQFVPIYIVATDLQVSSTAAAAALVISLDVLLAWLVHLAVVRIRGAIHLPGVQGV